MMRWSWKSWQVLVQEQITDLDTRELAKVWPTFAKMQHGKRYMWAQEIFYENAPLAHWKSSVDAMSRVMKAANQREAIGLASRCPGTPLYVPCYPDHQLENV